MNKIGTIRRIDELGRIVIPKELRTKMGFDVGTPLEIFVEDDSIILSKFYYGCHTCEARRNLYEFNGKRFCAECLEQLSKIKYR